MKNKKIREEIKKKTDGNAGEPAEKELTQAKKEHEDATGSTEMTETPETEETTGTEEEPESEAPGKIKRAIRYTTHTWIFRCFLLGLILEIVLEMLGRRSFFAAFTFIAHSPIVYLYNASIIFFTLLFALFLRKRIFGMVCISTVWLVCGIANFVVLGYRVTPFAAIDFLMVRDVISMIDVYFRPWQLVMLAIFFVALIIGLVILFKKTPRVEGSKHIKRYIFACMFVWVLLFSFTKLNVKYNVISDDFANLGMAYKDYGFAYCFTNSIIDNGISKPVEYEKSSVKKIKRELIEVPDPEKEPRVKPNIIVIQLESFFDPKPVKHLALSADPVPNFTRFKSQYPSGYLTVPALGAGTANSEFEVLTGIKSSYFGAGEYPYKTTVNKVPCVGMCSLLHDQGYGCYAIHNNTAAFYDRQHVYDEMGFDAFISSEYMYDVDHTPTGWIKDKTLVGDIMDCLDQTDGVDFVFTISVQGHGKYPDTKSETKNHVDLTYDYSEIPLAYHYNVENAFQYYVNQIYEMDEMIGDLKEKLDARKEPYVLVLYGDHLPSLDIGEDQLPSTLFQTEYVMVNNIGLTLRDKDIAAHELSNRLFEGLGYPMSFTQKAHVLYSGEELDEKLEMLSYDMLFGDDYLYNGKIPVEAPHMKLGVHEIKIDGVKNEPDHMVVTGENFNTFSVVYEDDDALETSYVNRTTLMVEDHAAEPGKVYTVRQVTKSHHELTSSEPYSY